VDISNLKNSYFIGIGGIGMSALARYFNERGVTVRGYDRVKTELTAQMEHEGIAIQYEPDLNGLDADAELVVYTPAIAPTNPLLSWFRERNCPVFKRADVLQWITESMKSITVAGTHGKTTVSTMIAHILRDSGYGCNAFLGGIAVNYGKNYWSSKNELAVIEADEYDRSFLKLKPDLAVLTAMDPDHLDIYGTESELEKAFIAYTTNIKPGGTLWYKFELKRASELQPENKKQYSLQNETATAFAQNIQMEHGGYVFDVVLERDFLNGLHLNIGGMHNVENCVVAVAVAKELGITDEAIKNAIRSFKGVKRRFEYVLNNDRVVYIDDYAHHPKELEALIHSAKTLFPKRRCVVAFQPHLFSRTRDFAAGFAQSLDKADEIILLDIYPAREEPIDGVSLQMIIEKMANPNCTILTKEGLVAYAATAPLNLFITAGAGDIDKLVLPIKEALVNKNA
jgi:UDP-N-acetylmuramate--alanine ligase